MPRVVVTGMGVISPIGRTVDSVFESLITARSGIRLVNPSLYTGKNALATASIDFDPSLYWPPHIASQYDRTTQFALIAAGQAFADAALDLSTEAKDIGVYWGSGLGGAASIEESYRMLFAGDGRVRPTSVVLGMCNAGAGQISIANGLRGPVLNVSTACSSSASAIGEAYRAIKHGYASVIVAGGADAMLTNGNLRAWDAMRALARVDTDDPSRSCKPFSSKRSGIVLGEGAAALILEREDRALARGARVYGVIAGYGNSADASHISKPDAGGQVRAMRAALADAQLMPADIQYINAHGTATIVGDVVETAAIKETFAVDAPRIPISSTKALHGHLIGATGALEMVATLTAMTRGVVPPTAHLDHPDPACDLDCVPNTPRSLTIDAAMSNSFGFGGMNAVLIVQRHH